MNSTDEDKRVPDRSGKTAALSALTRIGTFPITAISALVTASLTIQYAGNLAYAAISTVITLSQLMPFADLGVGAGVVNAVASGNSLEARRAVASATRILALSACGLVAVALTIGLFVGWDSLLGIGDAGLPDANSGAIAVIIIIALTLPFGSGQRILLGLMRNPTAIALSTVAPITALSGTILVIQFDLAPTFLIFPAILGSLLVAICSSIIGFRALGSSLGDVLKFSSFRYPGLLEIGVWYLILTLVSAFAFQSGRIVLAHASTLSQVANYSLVMQLYAPLWSFFVAGGTALWPIFARMRYQNSTSNILPRMLTLFSAMAVFCGVGLVTAGPWAARLISHDQLQPNWSVFAAAGILILIQAVQLVQGVSLTDAKGVRFQAVFALPMILIVPLMSWYAAPSLGASAPFIAAAVGIACFQALPNAMRLRRQSKATGSLARSDESQSQFEGRREDD